MIIVLGVSAVAAVVVAFLLSSREESSRALGWGIATAWFISIVGILLYVYVIKA
ncbi:MAG: hypothetical protein AAF493_14600 [Pseudomonadota bacterium]